MTFRAQDHVPVNQIPRRDIETGVYPQTGSVVQEMGTRQTWVFDGARWVPQNDDLGAKLDALNAAVKENTEVLQSIRDLIQTILD